MPWSEEGPEVWPDSQRGPGHKKRAKDPRSKGFSCYRKGRESREQGRGLEEGRAGEPRGEGGRGRLTSSLTIPDVTEVEADGHQEGEQVEEEEPAFPLVGLALLWKERLG